MGVKETLLEGLKPALTAQIKSDIAAGKLVQPADFTEISTNVWKHIRTNIQTAGAVIVFHIKKEDIDALLKAVFTELKVELK